MATLYVYVNLNDLSKRTVLSHLAHVQRLRNGSAMSVLNLAAVALAAIGGVQSAREVRLPVTQAQCDVAWAYIERILAEADGPVVFDDEPFFFLELPDPATRWIRPGTGPTVYVAPPPAALVQALQSQSPVRACESIRQRLDARRARFGSAAVRWALRVPRGRNYRARIVHLSLPAVSADGREAVMGEGGSSAPTAGGAGLVYLLRNEAGAWREAAAIGLYVS